MLELNVTKYSFPDHPDITIEVFGHNSARAIIQKNTSEEQAEEFPCTVLNTGAELVFHVYELRSVDGAPPVPVTLKILRTPSHIAKTPFHCSTCVIGPNLTPEFHQTNPNMYVVADQILHCYFTVQVLSKINSTVKIPDILADRIHKQIYTTIDKRKPTYMPLPPMENGRRICPSFAYKAYMDIWCKQLFSKHSNKENTSTKITSPRYLCAFFAADDSDELAQYISDHDLHKFALEDYIFYEQVTAVSFCVELCAALSCIPSEHIQSICFNVLKSHLSDFLQPERLFGRIALMREYVVNASAKLEASHRLHSNPSPESDKATAEHLLLDLLSEYNQYDSSTNRFDGCYMFADECRNRLTHLIKTNPFPVDLNAYIKNPVYGPLAFCNPSHAGVSKYLEDLCFFKSDSKSSYIPKRWKYFRSISQEILLLRSQDSKQAYSPNPNKGHPKENCAR